MGKPNYSFDKRKKELDRKRKKEEKQQRKLEKGPDPLVDQEDDGTVVPSPISPTPEREQSGKDIT